MSLRPIYGHRQLLDRLAGTLASSRFPQAALLTGPPGVGKQRIALWVAQGLLCESGPGAPCGSCRPCTQVNRLGHPDLHWFVPIPRPQAGDPAKQADEAAEALAEVMEERRGTGLWQRPEGTASHALASVRLLHRRASITPFSGDRKVFVIGDAERLVVQEASQEAANALLKVLEEPPADTTLILTAADPQGLLPTIRSRLVPVRVGRVGDDDVRAFLRAESGRRWTDRAMEQRVLLADGSIGQALWSGNDGDDAAAQSAEALLAAIREGSGAWLPHALRQRTWAARGEFTELLDALAVRLRGEISLAAADGADGLAPRIEALRRVEGTRAAAQGNANPQLALAALALDLEPLL
jgi:DNA polymerase-3 subunit delta'